MISIIKNRTASIDIDAQKGFTSVCPNELPINNGCAIVEELNNQSIFSCVRIGSKDSHPVDSLWIAKNPASILKPIVDHDNENIDIYWPPHCMSGSIGMELIDGLPKPEQYDFFVWKGVEKNLHPYGACFHDLKNKLSTGIIEFLKYRNIDTVIVGGLATDYCVKTTCLQLINCDLNVIINLSACRGVSEESSDIAISLMRSVGINIIGSSKELSM